MSPNPEQFSLPEKPNNIPTAGENPNEAGHLGDIPYDNEPIDKHYPREEDHTVDTGQIEQVLTTPHELPDGRLPARELPSAPEKSKRSVKIAIAAGAATIAAALGAWGFSAGATGNGFVNTNTPLPKPTAEGPAVPGQTVPSPQESATSSETAPTTELSFTDKTGNVQTYEELKESIQLPVGKYKNGPEALEAFFELHMSNMIDYRPTKEEVRNNLGLNKDQEVTLQHFLQAGKLHDEAYDHLYDTPAGDLHTTMQKLSQIGIKNWATSLEDPTKPYDPMSMQYDPINSKITLSDSQESVYYKLTGPDLTKSIAKVPQYEIPGRMNVATIK